MVSKKAITAALPRLDELRRTYILHGQGGCFVGRVPQTFGSAFVDYDLYEERGEVYIYTYGAQDAREPRHYYETDGTATITDEITKFIAGEASRAETVTAIQSAIQARIDPQPAPGLAPGADPETMSIKELRQAAGLTQAAMAKKFQIPKRTVENWETRGGCPTYVKLLIASALGL